MKPSCTIAFLAALCGLQAADAAEPADLIVHKAKVVTVDAKFSIAEAVAVKDGRIIAVGTSDDVLKLRGPKTRVIDAAGKTVLPGLYDSHVHPVGAATSELNAPLPRLKSLKDAFDYIRKRAANTPEGDWIVLYFAFPTRLDEAALSDEGRTRRGRTEASGAVPCGTGGHGQLDGPEGVRHQPRHEPGGGRRQGPEDRRADRHDLRNAMVS